MANLANIVFHLAVQLYSHPLLHGIIITKIGYYLFWLLSSITVMTLPGLLTSMFSDGNSYIPYIAGILNSVSYIFCGTLLTIITPLIIDNHFIATAYGIRKSFFNALFSVVTYVSGLIIDTFGYFILQGFFIQITMLCIDLILLMIFLDIISNGPKVNAPAFNFRIAEGKKCADSTHLKKLIVMDFNLWDMHHMQLCWNIRTCICI